MTLAGLASVVYCQLGPDFVEINGTAMGQRWTTKVGGIPLNADDTSNLVCNIQIERE